MRRLVRRSVLSQAGAFVWTGLDQVLSTVSNIVIAMALARGGGSEALGVYAALFAVYLLFLGFGRALVSEPLLAIATTRRGRDGADRDAAPPDVAAGTGLTAMLLLTGLAGLVAVVAGLVAGRSELLALGIVLPVACGQDLFRFLLFRAHRPGMAALIDATWAAGSVAAWPLLTSTGSATWAIAVWGLAALPGLVVGAIATGAAPVAPRRALRWWWTEARPLGGFLAIDTMLYTAAQQLSLVAIAAIAGAAALGELRAAQILFGPVTMTLTAFGMFVLPRIAGHSRERLQRLVVPLSGAAVGLAGVAAIVLWLAGPLLYRLLYGQAIEASTALILPVGVFAVVLALPSGPVLTLKAMRVGAPLAKAQLMAAVTGLPAVAAAATFGVGPAAWAMNLGEAAYNVVLWPRARRVLAGRGGQGPDGLEDPAGTGRQPRDEQPAPASRS